LRGPTESGMRQRGGNLGDGAHDRACGRGAHAIRHSPVSFGSRVRAGIRRHARWPKANWGMMTSWRSFPAPALATACRRRSRLFRPAVHRRRSARHNGETRNPAESSGTGRIRFGLGSRSLVARFETAVQGSRQVGITRNAQHQKGLPAGPKSLAGQECKSASPSARFLLPTMRVDGGGPARSSPSPPQAARPLCVPSRAWGRARRGARSVY